MHANNETKPHPNSKKKIIERAISIIITETTKMTESMMRKSGVLNYYLNGNRDRGCKLKPSSQMKVTLLAQGPLCGHY